MMTTVTLPKDAPNPYAKRLPGRHLVVSPGETVTLDLTGDAIGMLEAEATRFGFTVSVPELADAQVPVNSKKWLQLHPDAATPPAESPPEPEPEPEEDATQTPKPKRGRGGRGGDA